MSDLFENAVDSLRMGLSHYADERLATRDKWSILELFHAIELLLKERLFREHPLFIYKHLEKAVNDDALTVGLDDTLARFANLKIEITEDYKEILRDLKKRRNRIEHHRFVPDPSHRYLLGKALVFIRYFFEDHLDESFEDHLPEQLLGEAKGLILSYEELLARAEAAIDAERLKFDAKEQSMLETATCPDCWNQTVLIDLDGRAYCHFCEEGLELAPCPDCGEYLPPNELEDAGICDDCFSYKLNRD